MLDTSPVNCTCCNRANIPFERKSPVNRSADLRMSEKSSSSPEKTPLSVEPTELGVESPERGRILSKNPSTAIIDLPVKSSCRFCSAGRDAVHLPTSGDKAPGAMRTTFSRRSCGRSSSVNASGKLAGDMYEKVVSWMRLDISVRKAFICGNLVLISNSNTFSLGLKKSEQRSKPAAVYVYCFQWQLLGIINKFLPLPSMKARVNGEEYRYEVEFARR